MIRSSACPPWPPDQPGQRRRSTVPAVSYTTTGDTTEGNNLYNAVSEVPRSVQANLAPGFLEKSNVVGAYELINIAQLTRTYENVLKLMLSEASPNELQRLSGQTETN